MNAVEFAELYRVDGQTDVSVLCKPDTVMLVVGFIAQDFPFKFFPAVTANVKNCRKRFGLVGRPVQVGGDLQTRHRLELQVFDRHARLLQRLGDHRLQRRLLRHRI